MSLLETQWYLEPMVNSWWAGHDGRYQNSALAVGDGTTSQLAQAFRVRDVQSGRQLAQRGMRRVRLWLRRVGYPEGEMRVLLCRDDAMTQAPWRLGVGQLGMDTYLGTDDAQIIPGEIVGTSQTVSAQTLRETFTWIEFEFPFVRYNLALDTPYWLVLETTGTPSHTDHIQWGMDDRGMGYLDGTAKAYRLGQWVSIAQDTCFQVLADAT